MIWYHMMMLPAQVDAGPLCENSVIWWTVLCFSISHLIQIPFLPSSSTSISYLPLHPHLLFPFLIPFALLNSSIFPPILLTSHEKTRKDWNYDKTQQRWRIALSSSNRGTMICFKFIEFWGLDANKCLLKGISRVDRRTKKWLQINHE